MPNLSSAHLAIVEDLLFGLSGSEADPFDDASALLGRRTAVHRGALSSSTQGMLSAFDAWLVGAARAAAPVAPPAWLPMADLFHEKVTLEVGARGLRSLFRSTPSDKDVERVRKIGGFATRILRGVFAADGDLNQEELRTIRVFAHALGLAEADEKPLLEEAPVPAENLDVVGEVEPKVLKAILAGAWLSSAWDTIDSREEAYVRTLATRLSVTPQEVESARQKAIERVDARKRVGAAAIDGLRHVLSDVLASIPALVIGLGTLMLPKKHREEVIGPALHGTPTTLGKRHVHLAKQERTAALALAWAGALVTDPMSSRRLELAARHDAFAADLGDDGRKVRLRVEELLEAAMLAALLPE